MELKHTERGGVTGPRKESMVRLEIDVIPDGQVIPPGIRVPSGKHTVTVFASDVPVIEAMVETNMNEVQRAQADFDRALDAAIKKQCEGLPPGSLDAENEARKVRDTFTGSPQAMFQRNTERDMRPLRSVKVLEEGLPAPVNEEKQSAETAMAATIAATVATAMAKVLVDLVPAIAKGVKDALVVETKDSKKNG